MSVIIAIKGEKSIPAPPNVATGIIFLKMARKGSVISNMKRTTGLKKPMFAI
jgi:hypothetical protein